MAIPKYLQVACTIEKRIKNGIYPPQTFIPDQQALAQELNVSRLTVKKAIDRLERLGYVYKRSGYGTIVLSKIPIKRANDQAINNFQDIYYQYEKEKTISKIINFSIEFPDQEIQNNLFLQANDPVYNILRLRYFKENPLILEHLFIPLNIIPKLPKDALTNSLYDYFTKSLHMTLATTYRRINASKAQKDDLTYLNALKTDPILELEQIIWLSTGHPLLYSTARNKFNTISYSILYNGNY